MRSHVRLSATRTERMFAAVDTRRRTLDPQRAVEVLDAVLTADLVGEDLGRRLGECPGDTVPFVRQHLLGNAVPAQCAGEAGADQLGPLTLHRHRVRPPYRRAAQQNGPLVNREECAMSQEAMEVVLDHLYARRHLDVEAVAATLHPEVVHEGVRPEFICHNRGEVLDMVERNMHATRSGIERIEIIDAGPDQAVLGVAGPRFREVEEASPEGEVFILFTVRDRRIIRMRDFRDREDALAAAEGRRETG